MIAISIPGEPVAFARAGAHGSQRFTPAKQRGYMSILKQEAGRRMGGEPPMEGPVSLAIRATYLVPASWSARRKAEARWKTSAPDADNIAKIVKDALNTIVYRDDAQVADLRIQKMYGPIAGLTITVQPLDSRERSGSAVTGAAA